MPGREIVEVEGCGQVVGIDEMTIGNWERYMTIPLRRCASVTALCEWLRLDHAEIANRYPWVGSVYKP